MAKRPEDILRSAVAAANRKDYVMALALFQQVDTPESTYGRGFCHFKLGNRIEAIKHLEICLSEKPEFRKARQLLIRLQAADVSTPDYSPQDAHDSHSNTISGEFCNEPIQNNIDESRYRTTEAFTEDNAQANGFQHIDHACAIPEIDHTLNENIAQDNVIWADTLGLFQFQRKCAIYRHGSEVWLIPGALHPINYLYAFAGLIMVPPGGLIFMGLILLGDYFSRRHIRSFQQFVSGETSSFKPRNAWPKSSITQIDLNANRGILRLTIQEPKVRGTLRFKFSMDSVAASNVHRIFH